MKLAYADPVYLGQSKLYPEHPHSARWDDPHEHIKLMHDMNCEFDGWAMSLSTPSLRLLLPSAPEGVRIASWMKPFAAFKANVRIAYTWEPVIFKPGRDRSKDGAPVGRDHLRMLDESEWPALAESITLRKGLTGAKPRRFCEWILDLLGYVEGDEVVDLFPGTGIMGEVVAQGRLV